MTNIETLLERNRHGHIVLSVIGLNLTGRQELERLTAAGFLAVDETTKSCLLSTTENDGYDQKHHLVDGLVYKVALMPTRDIKRDADRSTIALCQRGIEKYQYEKPLAGIVPRIFETIKPKRVGVRIIVAPHDYIGDSNGGSYMLCVLQGVNKSELTALDIHRWRDDTAFAFFDPAS